MASSRDVTDSELRINGVGRGEGWQHEVTSGRLRDGVQSLIKVSDETWASYLCRGQEADTRRLHQSAATAAIKHWTAVTHEHESGHNGGFEQSPVHEIERFGVEVKTESAGLLDAAFIHFASFDPARKVVEVSDTSIAAVVDLIEKSQLIHLIGEISVRDVVLWHEYFHVRMRQQEQQSYSVRESEASLGTGFGLSGKVKNAVRRVGSVFGQYGSTAAWQQQVEELSAILFSKFAVGMSYSPQVLQWLLLYARDEAGAVENMKDIIEKSVKT